MTFERTRTKMNMNPFCRLCLYTKAVKVPANALPFLSMGQRYIQVGRMVIYALWMPNVPVPFPL